MGPAALPRGRTGTMILAQGVAARDVGAAVTARSEAQVP